MIPGSMIAVTARSISITITQDNTRRLEECFFDGKCCGGAYCMVWNGVVIGTGSGTGVVGICFLNIDCASRSAAAHCGQEFRLEM